MAKLDDFSVIRQFPNVGKHPFTVINVKAGKSKIKFTPQIELTLSTGEMEFDDQLFVTGKALNRLAIFAKRICGLPGETDIPENRDDAAKFLANHIVKNSVGKRGIVLIEETTEKFMPTEGPDAGRMIEKKRRRVAFGGYEEYTEESIEPTGDIPIDDEGDLPF